MTIRTAAARAPAGARAREGCTVGVRESLGRESVRVIITLKFGNKDYEVPVLTVIPCRAWREQLIAAAREVSRRMFAEGTNGHDEAFFNGLGAAFIAFPDLIQELVFAYAPDLPRQEILAAATEDEMVAAFSAVNKTALPFLDQLSLMAQITS